MEQRFLFAAATVLFATLFLISSVAVAYVQLQTSGNDTVSGYNVTEWFSFLVENKGPDNVSWVNITVPDSYDLIDVNSPAMWTAEATSSYAWFNTGFPMAINESEFFNISVRSTTAGNHTWKVEIGNSTISVYSQVDVTPPAIRFESVSPVLVSASSDTATVLLRWENGTSGPWMEMSRTDGLYTVEMPGLEEGEYVLRALANNSLGNKANATATYFADYGPPEIFIRSPSPTNYSTQEINVSYVVQDVLSPTVQCTYRLDNQELPLGTIQTNQVYNHKVVVEEDGSHVFYMSCEDLGGNRMQSDPVVFTIDLPEDYQSPPVVYYPPEKEEEEEDFDVQSSEVSLELEQGQNRTFSIQLYNNRYETLLIEMNSTVFVRPMLSFPTELEVPNSSMVTFDVSVEVPENATRGFYSGEINIFSNSTQKSVPVSIEVVKDIVTMFYSSVDVFDEKPVSGGNLEVQVKVFNLGETIPGQVRVNYTLRQRNNNTPAFAKSEVRQVQETTSYTTLLPLAGLTPGYYLMEVAVSSENYTDRSFSSFELVSVSFWDAELFGFRLRDIIITSALAVISAIALWRAALKARQEIRKRRKAEAKYEQTLKQLPESGEDTIYIGKVAETERPAHVETKELMKHTLICGGTGSGKTVAAMVIAEEAFFKGASVTVFDPTLQWTGFAKENRDKGMKELYPEFGVKRSKKFPVDIESVEDPKGRVDLPFEPGKVQVVATNKMDSRSMDRFLDRTLRSLFERDWEESDDLKHLIVFDEVHRLLSRYGGAGKAIPMVERAIREFRKWGIGVVLISQVMTDFKAAVRANVGNEVQMRTEFDGDIRRIRTKYGSRFSKNIAKLSVGTGMFQNPEYNEGLPYLVRFRPILHSPHGLSSGEVDDFTSLRSELQDLESRIKTLEKQGIDVYSQRVELDLARKNLKLQRLSMVKTYIESIKEGIKQ